MYKLGPHGCGRRTSVSRCEVLPEASASPCHAGAHSLLGRTDPSGGRTASWRRAEDGEVPTWERGRNVSRREQAGWILKNEHRRNDRTCCSSTGAETFSTLPRSHAPRPPIRSSVTPLKATSTHPPLPLFSPPGLHQARASLILTVAAAPLLSSCPSPSRPETYIGFCHFFT